MVTGFELIRTVLRTAVYSSDVSARSIAGEFAAGPPDEADVTSLAVMDRPDHGRVRKLVQGAFARKTEPLRGQIERLADDLLDRAGASGSMDFLADFVTPLTMGIFTDLLGVPPEDRAKMSEWAEAIFCLPVGGEHTEQAESFGVLARPVLEYLSRLVAERREKPGDDLVSALLQVREGGERLTEGEVLGNCQLLFLAAQSTINFLGTGLLCLFRFPDQAERLRRDPALLGSAIEEMLRYESPTQAVVRIAKEDCELDGQRIGRSSLVICAIGAANRDPAIFPDPAVFDVGRSPNPHIGFGHGSHGCLGAFLSRLEGKVVLSRILERSPRLAVDLEAIELRPNTVQRGLKRLPLTLSRG